MNPNQAYLNLKDSAVYLGLSYRTAKNEWPGWIEKFNVTPSRYPKRTLRFKKTDLDKIMELTKV